MEGQEKRQSKDSLKKIFEVFKNQYDKLQVDIMYMMECDKKSVKGMVEGTLEYLIKEMDARVMEEYDLELSRDEAVQYIKRDCVIHSETILGSITQRLSDENTLNKKIASTR